MSNDLPVPGPLPDNVKDACGFPRAMPIMLDAVTPDVPGQPTALLFHVTHHGGTRTWGLAWGHGAGARFGIERDETFTERSSFGEPPPAIADWVNHHWDQVVRREYIPHEEPTR